MKINILGTEYVIEHRSYKKDKRLKQLDGYTDISSKLIVIENDYEDRDLSIEKIELYKNKVLRHEIIHAFLYESGLDCNSNESYHWAENEEMVDWFAIQSPKIFKIYKKLNIL